MENITCVVDATTFVDKIHEIKDCVYKGYISLHIPICTSEKLEQIYQISLTPKEKEAPSKRSSYKAVARKEQPLFDVNPRIAREFLLRSKLETGNSRVTIQLSNEEFTQWKEEEKVATKVEQAPEERPTSFAQALLRKLNIAGEEEGGPKAPAKPRLVARDSAVPKSPWKYHKVPTISTNGVPASIRSLLSCMLWRLHEYENNPLMPESFVLLTNDIETRIVARRLSIPTFSLDELQQILEKKHLVDDDRQRVGQVEIEFGAKKREMATAEVEEDVNKEGEEIVCDSGENLDSIGPTDQNAKGEESEGKESNGETINGGTSQLVTANESEASHEDSNQVETPQEGVGSPKLNGVLKVDHDETAPIKEDLRSEEPSSNHLNDFERNASPMSNVVIEAPNKVTQESNSTETQRMSATATNGHVNDTMSNTTSNTTGISDDSDDADEVVVFNPKARRLSGRPKTPIEATKPPPAISYIKALETGLPKKPIAIPKPTIPAQQIQNQNAKQLEIPSQVKIETQSQPPMQSQNQGAGPAKKIPSVQRRQPNRRPEHVPNPTNMAFKTQNQMPAQIQSRPTLLPAEMLTQSKSTSPPKSPERKKSDEQIVLESVDQTNGRHQNNKDVQRPNHPAVQRVDQAFAKPQRQVQKQQRSFPIIDPDAFDRSFVIKPRNNTPNNNHRIMSPRGSPRGGLRNPEPEVDYVLKSGSTRAATRGRGKLWVP